jgi:predicted  nucleic acid-binding Zn-ribbon protein
MSNPFKLYRLQQVDTQLDKTRSRLEEIRLILDDDTELLQATDKLNIVQEANANAQKALKRAEQNVQNQQVKIDQNQKLLYGGSIKNPKELEDLQNEAGALRRYLSVLEDRQLESMIFAEDAESHLQQAQTQLEKIKAKIEIRNKDLTEEQTDLHKDVKRLESERAAAQAGITPEDMELYNKLRTSRAGLAVAKVENKICTACGTTLAQALAQAARSPNQISRCDTCGRILYVG